MTDWTSAETISTARVIPGQSVTNADPTDPGVAENHRVNTAETMVQTVAVAPAHQGRMDMPRQRLPANHSIISHPQNTVLLADPGGVIDEILRPALLQFADCRIVRAETISDVLEVAGSGVVGDLAMVSLRFQANTPVVIKKLREAGWPRVLALTTAAMPVAPVIEAIRAGASGVLSVAGVVESQPDENNPSQHLSPRELEVVRLVADGWSNKAIASQLSLSALTVKNHLARIGRKFGVGDRAHIVAIACRGGVIPNSVRQPRRFDMS
jgi:DNA-binding CsgD family transcriptional regulator